MIGVAGQVLFSLLTVNVLGAFLVIGGGLQFVHAIQSKGWQSVGIQVVLSILYIAAGLFTWVFPIPALEVITLRFGSMNVLPCLFFPLVLCTTHPAGFAAALSAARPHAVVLTQVGHSPGLV